MKRTAAVSAALVGGLVLAGCMPSDLVVDRPSPDATGLPALVTGINDSGLRIYLAARKDGENTAVSPVSIGLAFGMADAGASGGVAGTLEDFFGFPAAREDRLQAFNALSQGVSSEGGDNVPLVRIANRVYTDDAFTPLKEYRTNLATYFGADAESVPMATDGEAAAKRINGWVEDRTNGLVKDLVDPSTFNDMSRLMLVNTVYLKADWADPFKADSTQPYDFTALDGASESVPMMWQTADDGRAAVGDGWVAVTKPYVGGELEMTVILPDAGNFDAVEDSLGDGLLGTVDAALTPTQYLIGLPKFHAKSSTDLRAVIEDGIGVDGMFGVVGLDGIGDNLLIDSAAHAVTVIVDEEGTEAGAATAIGIMAGSAPAEPPIELIADRPFLYVIRDVATGAILFVGRVLDPLA